MALPVNGSTHLIPAYYSFIDPERNERLSWPSWLTCSGWFAHISGHPSAAGRAQDRESSPVRDRRSTTVLRYQPMDYDILLLLLLLFLNLGRSSRGGRQKIILEIIALMVNHPSGSHQQSSRAAG